MVIFVFITLHFLFRSRSRRNGLLSNACKIFDIGSHICSIVGAISFACKPFHWLTELFSNITLEILNFLAKVEQFFKYEIKSNLDVSGTLTYSKNSSTVYQEIRADLQSKTQHVLDFFKKFSNILVISLIFLFLKSLLYVKKYRTKDRYDNIYITQAFKNFDEDCKSKGQKSVLPLTQREVKRYIFTTSKQLSMTEISRLKSKIIVFAYHVMISALIIAFDYILYYVLMLIQTYANVALTVEGVNTIDIDVGGKGIFSIIIRYLVNNLNLNSTYSVDFNFTTCLPNPSMPRVSTIPVLLILYVCALFFTIMQGYGLRLRRKIASSFYPEQEVARIHYLHEKIIHERFSFGVWIKDLVFRRRKRNEVMERITFRGYLASRFPCFARCCECLLPNRRSCNCCDSLARRGMIFKKCINENCNAVFCQECFSLMKGHCLVCETKQEMRVP